VSRPFLERLARMAPGIATGLGLTESAGFCTYTPAGASVDQILAGIGSDLPAYPMSIRGPMRPDGGAGDVLPDGDVGNICFHGPQTFLGYVNDPEATARTVSRDGVLYTGDMGSRDEHGLHFSGRAKWIIKPAGHQVFPGDVENHICLLEEKVASCAAVGVDHPLLTEAIVAFVEKKPGAEITAPDLRRHAKDMASFMRPLHYVILEPGAMPLNRAAKSDYLRLSQMARAERDRLGWNPTQ
jgi:fatty-acyl-CoA synthase